VKKVDVKKEMAHLYFPPSREVVVVEVPELNYLMVDGEGDPNTSQTYADALEALFAVSYALKFDVKNGAVGIDYGVMPLEGLWWAENLASFTTGDRSAWKWTMMIMQPDFITSEMVADAIAAVLKKKNPVALPLVRFEALTEGRVAQTMHLGPFTDEGPTIERVHEFIRESGCRPRGEHHEIYLTDIRRAHPSKWKTVIRQPMGAA
jgi:hypothetical protein